MIYLNFFSHFGEIDKLEILGKISIVLFKTFFDASAAKEYLQNTSNFIETEKFNFVTRWYKLEDENHFTFSEELKNKLNQIHKSNFVIQPVITTNKNLNINSTQFFPSNYSKDHELKAEETKFPNHKYTCRYEIQIENDKEFQVVRRIIGSKGCNMKRIVEQCQNKWSNNHNDSVKLRLRGKGSGFKEGPNKQESNEPLHLCVSSKFPDKYNKACQLVSDLLDKIFEEYKRYCYKHGMIAVKTLAILKEEGAHSRKGSNI